MRSKVVSIVLGVLLCVSVVFNGVQFQKQRSDAVLVNAVNTDLSALNDQIAALNAKIDEQSATITALNKQLENLKADSEKVLAEKDKTIEELNQQLDNIVKTIGEIKPVTEQQAVDNATGITNPDTNNGNTSSVTSQEDESGTGVVINEDGHAVTVDGKPLTDDPEKQAQIDAETQAHIEAERQRILDAFKDDPEWGGAAKGDSIPADNSGLDADGRTIEEGDQWIADNADKFTAEFE